MKQFLFFLSILIVMVIAVLFFPLPTHAVCEATETGCGGSGWSFYEVIDCPSQDLISYDEYIYCDSDEVFVSNWCYISCSDAGYDWDQYYNGSCEYRSDCACTSHDYYSCYNNDVYWYDSCGYREDKKQECYSGYYTDNYRCSGSMQQREYRDRGCSGSSCYDNYYWVDWDSCTDCSCSCGGYNVTENTANGNCSDGKDNDCDGDTDSADSGCAATCAALNYPTDKWQRVWYDYDWNCLGDGPDETNKIFDNNWGTGVIAYGKSDYIQFTSSRKIYITPAGPHNFIVGSDDGFRLYIDGVLKIDDWTSHSYREKIIKLILSEGYHNFQIDYYEATSNARVRFNHTFCQDQVDCNNECERRGYPGGECYQTAAPPPPFICLYCCSENYGDIVPDVGACSGALVGCMCCHTCPSTPPISGSETVGDCDITITPRGWDCDASEGGCNSNVRYRYFNRDTDWLSIAMDDNPGDGVCNKNLEFKNSWTVSGDQITVTTEITGKDAAHTLDAGFDINVSGTGCSLTGLGYNCVGGLTGVDVVRNSGSGSRTFDIEWCGDGECNCGETNATCPEDCVPECECTSTTIGGCCDGCYFAPAGKVYGGGGDWVDATAIVKCASTVNKCTAGQCSGEKRYPECQSGGICDSSATTYYTSDPVYASVSKVLTSTCTNQDATADVKCAATVNKCTAGECSGEKRYPECQSGGVCDSSAATYYTSDPVYASAGYSLTSNCGTTGTTLCDSTWRASSGVGDNHYGKGGAYTCQGMCDGSGLCEYAANCGVCAGTLNVSISGAGACTVTASLTATDCDGKFWEVRDDGITQCSGTVSGSPYSHTCSSWTVGVGSYTYNLYIGGEWQDSKSVTCSETPNNPPTCSAGSDKTVNENQSVQLDCSASDPDGDALSYSWYCTGGLLNNSYILQPTYTAPSVSADTDYTCTLNVSDGRGGTCSDSMVVHVINVEVGPIINPPEVTTVANPTVEEDPANPGKYQAILNGYLNSLGYDLAVCPNCQCIVWFEWGTTTSYGNSTTSTSMTATGPFTAIISNLSPDATYYFEAKAKNGGSW